MCEFNRLMLNLITNPNCALEGLWTSARNNNLIMEVMLCFSLIFKKEIWKNIHNDYSWPSVHFSIYN